MTEERGSSERRTHREQRPELLRWIAKARSLAAALDLVPRAVVLASPGPPLQVWHANSAALHQFAAGVLRMADGALHPHPDCADAFERALEAACREGPGHPQQAQLATTGSPPFRMQLQVLEYGATPEFPVDRLLMLSAMATDLPERTADALRSDFKLTRKEAECALGLYAMGSMDAFARCSGKSIHTVRTQVKAVMAKTGTHSQAALVGLLGRRLSG